MGYFYTIFARFLASLGQGVGGQVSFSMAGIFLLSLPVCFSFSAYTMAILHKKFAVVLWVSIIIALFLTMMLGALFSYIYTKVSKDSFTVLCLGSILAFDAFVRSFDSLTGGVLGISGILRPESIRTLPALVQFSFFVLIVILVAHYLVLKSPMGRKIRAFKEHPVALQAFGVSQKSVISFVIIGGSLLSGISGLLEVFRIQFLDPSFGGIPNLIVLVSISILALKPKVKAVVLASMLVVFLPELISFLDFPSALLGHLRVLLYSVLLIVLIHTISGKSQFQKREI